MEVLQVLSRLGWVVPMGRVINVMFVSNPSTVTKLSSSFRLLLLSSRRINRFKDVDLSPQRNIFHECCRNSLQENPTKSNQLVLTSMQLILLEVRNDYILRYTIHYTAIPLFWYICKKKINYWETDISFPPDLSHARYILHIVFPIKQF